MPLLSARAATARHAPSRLALALGLSLATLLLAGCIGEPDPAASGIAGSDGDGAPGGLASAPMWLAGDWWTYRVDPLLGGEPFEVTIVVAAVEADHYLVGMPTEAFSHDALILHVPGIGEVAHGTLGFDVHDAAFEPLQFPLTHNAEWDTTFLTQPVTAVASVAEDGTTAEVEFAGGGQHGLLTYDPAARALTRIAIDGYATVDLVTHGQGFQGSVTVPVGQDLVLLHGRVAGVLAAGGSVGAPVETVEVADGYDRASIAVVAGTVLAPDGADAQLGVYREAATAPDGTTYETLVTPADGPGVRLVVHQVEAPSGTWTLEHAAAGAGVAFTEGMAYRVLEVDLPGMEG